MQDYDTVESVLIPFPDSYTGTVNLIRSPILIRKEFHHPDQNQSQHQEPVRKTDRLQSKKILYLGNVN